MFSNTITTIKKSQKTEFDANINQYIMGVIQKELSTRTLCNIEFTNFDFSMMHNIYKFEWGKYKFAWKIETPSYYTGYGISGGASRITPKLDKNHSKGKSIKILIQTHENIYMTNLYNKYDVEYITKGLFKKDHVKITIGNPRTQLFIDNLMTQIGECLIALISREIEQAIITPGVTSTLKFKNDPVLSYSRAFTNSDIDCRFLQEMREIGAPEYNYPVTLITHGNVTNSCIITGNDIRQECITEIDEWIMESDQLFEKISEDYKNIKARVGGCIVYIDNDKYLTHKDMKPYIDGMFISYKCPYTNSIVVKNISGVTNIRIDGMDTYYPPQPLLS